MEGRSLQYSMLAGLCGTRAQGRESGQLVEWLPYVLVPGLAACSGPRTPAFCFHHKLGVIQFEGYRGERNSLPHLEELVAQDSAYGLLARVRIGLVKDAKRRGKQDHIAP